MSFESELTALFNPLADNRVYWDKLPEGTRVTEPTILLEHGGGRPRVLYVEKELQEVAHARVRIQVFSPDKQEASDLSRLIERTLLESDFDCQTYGAFVGMYVPEVKLHQNRQDFGIFYSDP